MRQKHKSCGSKCIVSCREGEPEQRFTLRRGGGGLTKRTIDRKKAPSWSVTENR